MTWSDLKMWFTIWYGMIWCMVWFDMIWCDMIYYDMIWMLVLLHYFHLWLLPPWFPFHDSTSRSVITPAVWGLEPSNGGSKFRLFCFQYKKIRRQTVGNGTIGVFKWRFTTKVDLDQKSKVIYPTKSTIANNFVNLRASHGHCPNALPAEFGTYGDKPVMETHRLLPGTVQLERVFLSPKARGQLVILQHRQGRPSVGDL